MMVKGKTIVLGITGGIAAYKVVEVASRLKKMGAKVRCIMTKGATEFITPLTLQSITHEAVAVDMFSPPQNWNISHISLAQAADCILIAPATYNCIGKVAQGLADDLLTATIAASKAPVLFAPAMNTNMYQNPILQKNIAFLRELGYGFIEPARGRMACGTVGEGRLPEPEHIVEDMMGFVSPQDLSGVAILITAGPTWERLDPVRLLTNPSSGKMGYALARAASRRGAQVTLITGPTHVTPPRGLHQVIRVESTRDMLAAVLSHAPGMEVIIKAAAPSDFRPRTFQKEKVKKDAGETTIFLEPNVDILESVGQEKEDQILVGFAAETEHILENARGKLKKKNLDMIIANPVHQEGSGFAADANQGYLITRDYQKEIPLMDKLDLAHLILDEVLLLQKK